MENFFDIDPEGLTMSTRALQKVLKERGWTATFLRSTHQYVFAKRQDSKIFRIVGTVPESTSYVAGRIANDKLASYELLKQIGVKQAETEVATLDSVSRFLSRYGRIVIKPVDGAHGNGITTDITTSEAAIEAIETAKRFSYSGTAIVQEQLDFTGFETRVICIDYKFVEGLSRIPAYITGDGEHTVSELIDIENTTIRTEPYKSNLAFIDREYAEKYMAEKRTIIMFQIKGKRLK